MGMHLRYFPEPWKESKYTVEFPGAARCPYKSGFKIFVAIELPEIWPGKGRNLRGEMHTEITF